MNVHYVHLDVGEHRVLHPFTPVRTVYFRGKVVAKAELFGKVYHCRLMDKIPAWRLCDANAEYVKIDFPQLKDELRRQLEASDVHEKVSAAPYSWEDESK